MNKLIEEKIISQFEEALKDGDFGKNVDEGHLRGFITQALTEVAKVREEAIGQCDYEVQNVRHPFLNEYKQYVICKRHGEIGDGKITSLQKGEEKE